MFKVGDMVRIKDCVTLAGWYIGFSPDVEALHGDVGIVTAPDTDTGHWLVRWLRSDQETDNWSEKTIEKLENVNDTV